MVATGGRKIDIGFRFGKLTVAADTGKRKNGYTVWRCECDCGGSVELDTRTIQRGTVLDCGCETRTKPGQRDLTGMRFGKLIAVSPTDKRKCGTTVWRCICDCDKVAYVPAGQLLSGYVKSCGCLQAEVYRENLKLMDGTSVTLLEAGKKRLISSNTSGYTGVYRQRKTGKWAAQITFRGKTYFLGAYDKKEDAIKARQRGEEMHDEFLEWYHSNRSV